MLTRTTLALGALLAVTLLACGEQPVADEDSSAESSTSDLTSSAQLRELQEEIHLSVPSRLWVRCSVGRGKSKTTFDVVDHPGTSKLEVLTRYFAADFNSQAMGDPGKMEIVASLGKAENASTDIYHRIFSFKIRDEATTLDVFGEKGSFLRFRGNDIKATCESYDF